MFRVKGPLNCSPWVPRRVSKEAFCRGLYGLHEFTRVLPGLRFFFYLICTCGESFPDLPQSLN